MMNIIIASTSSWLDDESYQDLCSDPGKVFILKNLDPFTNSEGDLFKEYIFLKMGFYFLNRLIRTSILFFKSKKL